MLLPILLAIAVCSFGKVFEIHAFTLSDPVRQEEGMQMLTLDREVKLIVRPYDQPSEWAFLRVIARGGAMQHQVYSLDVAIDQWSQVEEFFAQCRMALASLGGHASGPMELSVVAVGDVAGMPLQALVEEHLCSLPLATAQVPTVHVGKVCTARSDVAVHLHYPTLRHQLKTCADLREQWVDAFVQEIYQQRLERISRFFDQGWVHASSRLFFPRHGYALTRQEDVQNTLGVLLWQVEAMKRGGCSAEDLSEIRLRTRSGLQYLAAGVTHVDGRTLADYYVDHILNAGEIPEYEHFLRTSIDLIETISLEDLNKRFKTFLDVENRRIAVVYPEHLHQAALLPDDVQDLVETVEGAADFHELGGLSEDDILLLQHRGAQREKAKRVSETREVSQVGRLPLLLANAPMPVQDGGGASADLFFHLPLTSGEKRIIDKIITTMADKNVFQLAMHKKELEKNGQKIDHVHPLRFIGFIFSDHELKRCVKQIRKSHFKWDAFVDGFSRRMKEEMGKGNVMMYVPGFSQMLHVSQEDVSALILKHDYEGLVRFLL